MKIIVLFARMQQHRGFLTYPARLLSLFSSDIYDGNALDSMPELLHYRPLERGSSSSSVRGGSSPYPRKLIHIIFSRNPYDRERHCANTSVQLAKILVARVAPVTTEITPCCRNSSIIISPWGVSRNQTHSTLVCGFLSIHIRAKCPSSDSRAGISFLDLCSRHVGSSR